MKVFKALVSVLSMSVVVGCTSNLDTDKLNPHLADSNQIISTRPQNSEQFIAVLKLKNPSLLESAKKINGKSVVDADLLVKITQEQDEVIATLKALSSEIQVIYKYKMVLNAIAVLSPNEFHDKIKGLGQIVSSEFSGNFARPIITENTNSVGSNGITERNSSKFIGAEALNLQGISGKGMKVGIIDTGIDYTHSMFTGAGTEEAFKAIDPSGEAVGYPNSKVVGGIDLVGTAYDAASPDFAKHIPKPDMNPIDEAGHGTHVAGTVAGLGDGVVSYNGMAPDAELHAIKVFGANGSTSDVVVIAALEYSVDPNADGDISDKLDVVNMSLGGGYGDPHILYAEAVKNLVNGDVVVVASGGNSGASDYIVGSPGTSTEALSVAASVDNSDQNWKFNSSKINLGAESILVEAIEAATTKQIADAGNVTGKLVYVGLAAEDFTEEMKAAVKGHVAFIDRGTVTFNDKIKRAAAAGAIGVVVGNNAEGSSIAMGTTDVFDIPAIMISLDAANKVKAAQKNSDVTIEFLAQEKIEKTELIDTLTDFSSKGPRSVDGFIKPEISAPGSNVISAKIGGGKSIVQMSGTSMSAPHMAGVVALVKQAQPNLSAKEIKNIVMGTSKTIGSAEGQRYPVSMQGAGRVQADKAANSKLVVLEPSISIGETAVESKKSLRRSLSLKNLTAESLTVSVVFEGSEFISMMSVNSLIVPAKETMSLSLTLTLDATKMKDESTREMDGWVKFMDGEREVYRVPVLAIAHKLSALQANQLTVHSGSSRDAVGAAATLEINNANQNAGEALLFNLINGDERKPRAESYMTSGCDMQSAGYRIVTQENEKGESEDVLQIAVKTYKPMTTWHPCDVSVLIDSNGDGIPEQELLGASLGSIPNQNSEEFASTLIDAAKAREIRKAFEAEVDKIKDDPKKLQEIKSKELYDEALLGQRGMKLYNNSTVVIVEAAVSQLAKTDAGHLSFRVVLTHNEQSSVESDDFLAGVQETQKTDRVISLNKAEQSFVDLKDTVVQGNQTLSIELTKGEGAEDLLILMPQNKFTFSDLVNDAQSQIVAPSYK
ncbi:MAG: hypothetical protein A2622_01880 [Bdellovibrionales bacterium RIFCSPHIGHO2_01_FULL_40_29]|nr:MAG: hypothetical protein A2622_01880 [Bdellovibrionales bacterium RIFCSPHIGHO2_01_FULL_40_29]OFZ33841.1 MAG: hypothetical protein A3D17_02300 [Bdellovibrionales bacterium RIFCSPHIGHO2_02_FULL_40_15]